MSPRKPPMPTITRSKLLAYYPCWTAEQLDRFLAKFVRGAWTILDVLTVPTDDEVDPLDRIWVVNRLTQGVVGTAARNHHHTAWCARPVGTTLPQPLLIDSYIATVKEMYRDA